MPYYDYKCTSCAHCFEVKQGFHDEPVATCPNCQAPARRLVSAPPIIFKGSGFYVTDNRKTSSEDEKPKRVKSENSKEKPKANKSEADTTKTGENKGVASKS